MHGPMSTWFDKLLEDLQRRQAEQDARREGRPLPPRRPRSGDGRGNGGDVPPDDRPTPFPRRPGDMEFGRTVRRWILIGGILLLVLFLLGFTGGLVNLVTDLMWYEALGAREVLTTRLWAQVGLFAVGLVAFALPALGSIWLSRRIAPQVPIRRIGTFEIPDASRAITWTLVALVVLLALVSAGAWSGNWETVLLFANGGDFGTTDPHFGRDVGFYVFDIPFWRFIQGWAVTSMVAIILLSVGAYAAGAMRWQFQLSAPVRAHLSVLGALLLASIAAGYQLDIYELSYSVRGSGGAAVQAATHTDLTAQQPAYVIITVVALAAAALLLANIWFRTLWLLAIAGLSWIGISILVGGLYPGFVQNFQVVPNEQNVERPYLVDHIAATRTAMELDTIDLRRFSGEEPLSRDLFEQEGATLNNLRLWDYRPLLSTFGQQQILRQYYTFEDVDIDRYQIDDEVRQLMLSAREIKGPPEESQTWTNERLVYTHGYGLTAVPVNAVTPEGQPGYLVSGIGREERLGVEEPRVYFGELEASDYVVVGTGTQEFDFPVQDGEALTTWEGKTGVGIGNWFTRALFGLRFGDFNLLISNQITDQSQILFKRTIQERVPEVAPFLAYDRDPYLVAADGQLVWLWDAYTLTGRYPNAQPLREMFAGANYVRNSVKVAIDAYDGSMTFYIADPTDPIVAAYARIFPDLFEPMDAMPEELRAHIRYPEGLFRAQAESYLLYHVPPSERGADTLYGREDAWQIPQALEAEGRAGPMEPYYVIMKLPGEESVEFVLIQPLVAANRPNMIAWIAARNDGEHYGERIAFNFPSDTTVHGPQQVEARIDQDTIISAQFSLWDRAGSRVIRGNLLVLPMGDSILYVEPIFLQAEQARFPEFVRIILVSQTRLAFAETLEEGLRQILGEAPLPPPEEPEETPEPGATQPPEPEPTPSELPEDVEALVAEAQRLYDDAQAALDRGDLGAYQQRIDELGQVLERIAELTGQ
jgi:uncharacterized membrane protein (UPF0182 family)